MSCLFPLYGKYISGFSITANELVMLCIISFVSKISHSQMDNIKVKRVYCIKVTFQLCTRTSFLVSQSNARLQNWDLGF